MFNYHRHTYQIGMDDWGGGGIHPNRYEAPAPPPQKLVQLRYHEPSSRWVHGENGMVVLSFKGDTPEPMCNIDDTVTIKIRDYIIECKKTDAATYAILKIKSVDGAIFNTLQLKHDDPFVKMIRAYVTVPVTDMYK